MEQITLNDLLHVQYSGFKESDWAVRQRIQPFLIVVIFFFLVLHFSSAQTLASSEQEKQKTLHSVQATDLSVSPFKGAAGAPVVIAVFSDFQ